MINNGSLDAAPPGTDWQARRLTRIPYKSKLLPLFVCSGTPRVHQHFSFWLAIQYIIPPLFIFINWNLTSSFCKTWTTSSVSKKAHDTPAFLGSPNERMMEFMEATTSLWSASKACVEPGESAGCFLLLKYHRFIVIYGCFLKWWYPTTMGFPTKNDHFGVFWGYPYFWKHPYICVRWKKST